jgi:hypothetical protein
VQVQNWLVNPNYVNFKHVSELITRDRRVPNMILAENEHAPVLQGRPAVLDSLSRHSAGLLGILLTGPVYLFPPDCTDFHRSISPKHQPRVIHELLAAPPSRAYTFQDIHLKYGLYSINPPHHWQLVSD